MISSCVIVVMQVAAGSGSQRIVAVKRQFNAHLTAYDLPCGAVRVLWGGRIFRVKIVDSNKGLCLFSSERS